MLGRSSTVSFLVQFMNNISQLQVFILLCIFFVSLIISPNLKCIWRTERNVESHLAKKNTVNKFFSTKFCVLRLGFEVKISKKNLYWSYEYWSFMYWNIYELVISICRCKSFDYRPLAVSSVL